MSFRTAGEEMKLCKKVRPMKKIYLVGLITKDQEGIFIVETDRLKKMLKDVIELGIETEGKISSPVAGTANA